MDKQQWRTRLLAARRARPPADLAVAHHRIATHLTTGLTAPDTGMGTICVYLPLRSEPLPPELPDLLASTGWQVLVPVTRRGEPLDWCVLSSEAAASYDALQRNRPAAGRKATLPQHVVVGGFGIAEPTGPRLGAAAIRTADVVLVPALAVDRSGRRLGRGGGFYDRTLALLSGLSGGTRLIAVIFDEEWVDDLPGAAHDVPVTEVVTPSGGIRPVGAR